MEAECLPLVFSSPLTSRETSLWPVIKWFDWLNSYSKYPFETSDDHRFLPLNCLWNPYLQITSNRLFKLCINCFGFLWVSRHYLKVMSMTFWDQRTTIVSLCFLLLQLFRLSLTLPYSFCWAKGHFWTNWFLNLAPLSGSSFYQHSN